MTPQTLKMKSIIFDTTANSTVWLGAITTWQIDFDYWVRMTAGLCAIGVSLVTIYYKIKKNGTDK